MPKHFQWKCLPMNSVWLIPWSLMALGRKGQGIKNHRINLINSAYNCVATVRVESILHQDGDDIKNSFNSSFFDTNWECWMSIYQCLITQLIHPWTRDSVGAIALFEGLPHVRQLRHGLCGNRSRTECAYQIFWLIAFEQLYPLNESVQQEWNEGRLCSFTHCNICHCLADIRKPFITNHPSFKNYSPFSVCLSW